MNENRNEFYRLAEKAGKGLTALGATLGLTHVTAANYGPVLQAAKADRLGFNTSRHDKREGYQTLQTARQNADAFITSARDYLTTFLGNSWSASWAQIGFDNGTLALPKTDASRAHALESVKVWFTNNPDREMTTPEVVLTAARADALLTALTDATSGVDDRKLDTRTNMNARSTTEAALDKKLNCLYRELESVLDPLDPRWLKFIDRIPGDPRVPEPVTEVTATAQPGGIILVDWPDAVRAARYKVLKQVVGVDAQPTLAATVDDSDAQITGVPTGATVQLQIVATNEKGDAPASAVIQLQAA
ncbi:MAG: hypothetical protein HY043_19905 [Verrucomicrobia bacterium]|nr:hypothetical protein [Verrucomicrobiota bacterium]